MSKLIYSHVDTSTVVAIYARVSTEDEAERAAGNPNATRSPAAILRAL